MDHLVFIIDLNELESADVVPVSMDFTVNYGPYVWKDDPQPKVGEIVCVHSDDDDTLYYATVIEHRSARDLAVRIDWTTCQPVLNQQWSARGWPGYTVSKAPVTEADQPVLF